MKFLCLIHLDEKEMAELPRAEMNSLNVQHLTLNEGLRASGNLIEAEALEPSASASRIRIRGGRRTVLDGPFTETKELVAGFYLLEANDMHEAVEIASRFPSAEYATIDVWPTRQLIVKDGSM